VCRTSLVRNGAAGMGSLEIRIERDMGMRVVGVAGGRAHRKGEKEVWVDNCKGAQQAVRHQQVHPASALG